jgi:hypothetical protein
MFNILETKEPYYAIIDHDEKCEIISLAKEIIKQEKFQWIKGSDQNFKHQRLYTNDCVKLVEMSPLRALKNHCKNPYASIFSTAPGCYYRAHKDGLSIRFALNYLVDVEDNCCVTSWYDDRVSDFYKTDTLDGRSRELDGFNKSNHQATCSTVFLPNQCVLFNTDVYHDFDNQQSNQIRNVLTIRFSEPDSYKWQDALTELKNLIQNVH